MKSMKFNRVLPYYLSVFLLFLYSGCRTTKIELKDPNVEDLLESNKYFIISDKQGNQFLLDTGSSSSYISDNYLSEFIERAERASINSKEGFTRVAIGCIDFNSFQLENFRFTLIPSNSPIFDISDNLVGIIGMDILSRQVSYWNIHNGTFIFGFDTPLHIKPKLILKYNFDKVPFVNLIINGKGYKNIIMDTGYYNLLGVKSIKSDFGDNYVRSQSRDVLGNVIETLKYKIDSINIQGVNLNNEMYLSVGKFKYELLGSDFFSFWDFFVIDPQSKEFRFYKK